MNFKLTITVLLAVFMQFHLTGQPQTYSVKKAPFSTDKYDEFSPVGYKNGIVFCTNRPSTRFLSYSTSDNKSFIQIDFVDTLPGTMQNPRIFSKELNSRFNNGPVTFNSTGDTVYFSRNLIVDGKLSDLSSPRNKLGIFYAVLDAGEWTKIREFRVNSEWYNVTTPWLSPDGQRIYFASDKPEGYGGTDLYYCQWKNDYWDDPVNLGPVINTTGNESYPFINAAGEFFFSSDGHPGLGGKDIFFSQYVDSSWTEPVCLDAPVNSEYDDFGIYTDPLMGKGYFSSNRGESIDIYEFTTLFPQVFYTTEQKENNYCYNFSDTGAIAIDTINLHYVWSFGDGESVPGKQVIHCYKKPGNYEVSLDVVEIATGRKIFNMLQTRFNIHDFEQAYITSRDYAVKGENIRFDGLKSYIPGYKIIGFSWDFGDRTRARGAEVSHAYSSGGEYDVNLELALKSDSAGRLLKTGSSKKIRIYDTQQEASQNAVPASGGPAKYPDFRNSLNTNIQTIYSAEEEFRNDAVFRVELLTSKTRLTPDNNRFKNIPSIYRVKEELDPATGEYSYTVDQHLSLLAAYPAYKKMVALGFNDARIRMFVLKDPEEKDLLNLIRINGAYADSYFDSRDRLTSDAFIMLDQIVRLMNRYPSLKLEVAVHTDNSGSADNNLAVSQKRAQALVDYMVTRGISIKRLVPVGYGGAKPVASNLLARDRKQNRRVDFVKLSK